MQIQTEKQPLLADVLPAFATELQQPLNEQGEPGLAAKVRTLVVFDPVAAVGMTSVVARSIRCPSPMVAEPALGLFVERADSQVHFVLLHRLLVQFGIHENTIPVQDQFSGIFLMNSL